MHFSTHVFILPGPLDPSAAKPLVDAAMAPYDESLEVEQITEDGETWWTNPDSFWDWYQIGGRWKGAFVSDYDPDKDPAHQETCRQCGGTGTRPNGLAEFGQDWFDRCNGCNGCNGTGQSVKWPTEWGPHDNDVITVEQLLVLIDAGHEQAVPYYAVIGDTFFETGGGWSKDEAERERLATAARGAYRETINEAIKAGTIGFDYRVVIVDCHS
jgi:hypothetical protein